MADETNPGLPRPVQVGTAWYVDGAGIPQSAPIYEPGPATNGQRIQREDIGAGWVLVRKEKMPTDDQDSPDRLARRLARLEARVAAVDGKSD